MPGRRLSLDAARRLALASQGFGRPRPASVSARTVQGVVDRLAQFQIDSVNVVKRAHYLPLFSRLGAYDTGLLDAAAQRAPRRVFEYWGHEASLIDVELYPALRWRMARSHPWGGLQRIMRERPEFIEQVYESVAVSPSGVTARQLGDDAERPRVNWGWNWSDTKLACEWLFHAGRILALGRNSAFERIYALPERVLPAGVLARETPSDADAHVELARRALRALGVADAASVGDYFRVRAEPARAALDRLVTLGEAEPVTVDGLRAQHFLAAGATVPRRMDVAALVSPFDSVMFLRPRLSALFGFDYRIEIYVPAPERKYGYYVYPFLLGDKFVGRVDLKADRAGGVLLVNAAWLEAGESPDAVAPALAAELRSLAGWLGLHDVAPTQHGNLGASLARALTV